MKARKPRTSRALLDVILSVLAMVLLLIGQKAEGDLVPRVDYVLEVSWPDNAHIDIDTWIMLPSGDKVWFKNKDRGYATIDRDDLGSVNDPAPPNIETTSFRALANGIYYVSIHNYRGTPESEMKIVLEFKEIGAARSRLARYIIPMPSAGQETPVFKFLIKDKKIVWIEPSNRMIVGLR